MRVPVTLPATPSYKRHAVCPACAADIEVEVAAIPAREGSVDLPEVRSVKQVIRDEQGRVDQVLELKP